MNRQKQALTKENKRYLQNAHTSSLIGRVDLESGLFLPNSGQQSRTADKSEILQDQLT